MISCKFFHDPAGCLGYREELVAYRQQFRIPMPSDAMCLKCRRARPEVDRLDSEELLGKMRAAGW